MLKKKKMIAQKSFQFYKVRTQAAADLLTLPSSDAVRDFCVSFSDFSF